VGQGRSCRSSQLGCCIGVRLSAKWLLFVRHHAQGVWHKHSMHVRCDVQHGCLQLHSRTQILPREVTLSTC
jgi:hypothetical protein